MSDKKEWWRGSVIYQIYPRSYCDSNGDGIGDLRGIISKLDYVASLNIDAIWISPFFRSPMKDFGYDISSYRDVDPIFGTLDDFRLLLKEAHARGIKILLDQVWSHTSDEHNWFKESRSNRSNAKQDWYVWADCKPDGTPPNNWLSIFGGPAWTWDTRREQYYLHHFLSCQPALNLWNPQVREAITQTARYWLDMGIDGFRLDVINCALSHPELHDNPVRPADMSPPSDMHATNPMARQIRSNAYGYMSDDTWKWLNHLRGLAEEYEGIFLMGEIGGDDGAIVAPQYTQNGDRLHSAYSFSLTGKTITKDIVIRAINRIEDNVKDGWMTYAFGNHDNTRFASNHGQHENIMFEYSHMGMALLLSMRGSVCIYQGEELGLPVADISFEQMQDPYDIRMYPDSMNRDGGRTPMPWAESAPQAGFSSAAKTWLPVSEAHVPLAVDKQDNDDRSLLNAYRRFIQWRKEEPVLQIGTIEIVESPDDVIVFKRNHNGKTLLCVFNTANAERGYTLPEGEAYDFIARYSRSVTPAGAVLSFERYGYAFLEQK